MKIEFVEQRSVKPNLKKIPMTTYNKLYAEIHRHNKDYNNETWESMDDMSSRLNLGNDDVQLSYDFLNDFK